MKQPPARPEPAYSSEERATMLKSMREASDRFYRMAVKIQCHPFIEFSGLMHEYIQMCERAHQQGIDFTQTHAHSGYALPMQSFNAAYLGEKIGCIYGPSLQQASNAVPFLEAIGLPLPRAFDVTDPERDAPDGAVVDQYERQGDKWIPRYLDPVRAKPLSEIRPSDVPPGMDVYDIALKD